jgi:hypothetical protein
MECRLKTLHPDKDRRSGSGADDDVTGPERETSHRQLFSSTGVRTVDHVCATASTCVPPPERHFAGDRLVTCGFSAGFAFAGPEHLL